MFAFTIDLAMLVPFATFACVAVFVWLIADRMRREKPRLEDRLAQMHDVRGDGDSDSSGLSRASAVMSDWLAKATPVLSAPIQPKKVEDASKLRLRLSHGGFRSEAAPTIFLGLKIILLLAAFFFGGGSFLLTMGLTKMAILRSLTVTFLAFFLPDIVLWMITRKRQKIIFLGLPDAIDLMVVCVEAGVGLDAAMRKVVDEMKKSYHVISAEFGIANMQLQMGISRNQVLRDLGQRNGEEDLQSLVSVLVQASRFGSGVGQALRVQSETMRTRRRQIAEEKAAKTAVKLIFPLVLFIFPGIFVVLVGPAAISIIRHLLPTMNGAG